MNFRMFATEQIGTASSTADYKSSLEKAIALLNELLIDVQLDEAERRASSLADETYGDIEAKLQLLDMARRLIATRKIRAKLFPAEFFGEPPWDMLLQLYVADYIRERINVHKLSEITNVPGTTTKRCLEQLEELSLIDRESHPTDLRQIVIRISDHGRDLIELYLRQLILLQATT